MIITHKLSLDLVKGGTVPKINAVQYDKYGRHIELSLFADGVSWTIPSGVSVVIHYVGADGICGSYDTLADGTAAYTITKNRVTIALAPQVCAVGGITRLSVCLMKGSTELNTVSILVHVQGSVQSDFPSGAYYRLSGVLPASGWAPNMYLRTDDQGNVILTPEAPIHSVVWNLMNITSSNYAESVAYGEPLAAALTAIEGFTLETPTITMGGEELTGVWNSKTSVLHIPAVTGDVVVSCVGRAQIEGEPPLPAD